jgi:hypothetical protein
MALSISSVARGSWRRGHQARQASAVNMRGIPPWRHPARPWPVDAGQICLGVTAFAMPPPGFRPPSPVVPPRRRAPRSGAVASHRGRRGRRHPGQGPRAPGPCGGGDAPYRWGIRVQTMESRPAKHFSTTETISCRRIPVLIPDNTARRPPLCPQSRDTPGRRRRAGGHSPGESTPPRKKPAARQAPLPPSSTSVSLVTCELGSTAIWTGSRARLGSRRIAG